jgi:hypothetical protein
VAITMRNRNLGFMLLAVWLILAGIVSFTGGIAGLGLVQGILALAAGILILMGR